MSESSRVALASPTVVDDVEQRPVRSGRRRGSIFAAGVTALAGVAAISCGIDRGEVKTTVTATVTSPAPTTERPYCTDTGSNELPLPVIEGNKVYLTFHSECTGDPNAPNGVYKPSNSPSQDSNMAAGKVHNQQLIEPHCTRKGQYIQTDAAGWNTDPNTFTGTSLWVEGTIPSQPELGVVDTSATLLGYPSDANGPNEAGPDRPAALDRAYAEQNLPQLPPCPPV